MKSSTTGVTGIGLNTMDTTFTRKQRLLLTAPNCDAGGQCAKQGHYRPWSSRNFCSDSLLVAPALIDVNHYRPQIEGKLRDRLGREVSLGPMKLSLIPMAFLVENVEIAEDPAFRAGRPFAQVQKLFIRPRLLPLLHHEVEIQDRKSVV